MPRPEAWTATRLGGPGVQAADAEVEAAFVVTGATVFDGESNIGRVDVVVREDLIEAVGSAAGVPAYVPRVDGTGARLLPGLIDAHTHTQDIEELQEAMRFGVTTVLNMFTQPQHDAELRRASTERADLAGFF